MRYPTIGFDIDGVVADIFPLIAHFMREKYSVIIAPNMQTNFNFEDTTGLSRREIDICVSSAIMNYMSYKPYHGAIQFLKKYNSLRIPNVKSEKGLIKRKELIFITARDNRDEIAKATYKWLHMYLHPEPFTVRFVPGNNGKEKFEACMELGVDLFIEDRAKTAVHLACSGISTILMNRPWNVHVPDDTWNLVRFNDWEEIDKGITHESLKYKTFNL